MGDEALTGRVQGGGPYAVVGGDADHVDLGDGPVAQPLGEAGPVLVGALETAVRGRVGALVEDGVDGPGGDGGREVRVEADALRTGDAVHRPGVLEVRGVGEVVAGVDVVVPGGDHVPVAGLGLTDEIGDGGGDVGTTRHREAAALAEVVLNVHDDQCAVHGGCP
ncbi:hypothetical protein SMICM17S_07939 [Streptomyces microflavus]